MQFDQVRRQFAQQSDADRLVVDESLRCAIGLEPAADQQRRARFHLNLRLGQDRGERRLQRGEFEAGGNAGLILSGADQRGIGAVAQHQPQRIEQDRLARPGLTGQHPQPARKGEVQRLDQDDVADGQRSQHVRVVF